MRAAQIDHAVINVHYELDRAERLFKGLGFYLAARGYHSLGSINHAMMFGTDYLELIGLPKETEGLPPARPEVMASPVGINGLVFKTYDMDETWAHLQALGMADIAPKSFSRPVELASGETQDAQFRTVTVNASVFPGGRVYFCQHLTPELLWRAEWQSHANGASRIAEFVIVSKDYIREADNLSRLLRSKLSGQGETLEIEIDGARISILSVNAYNSRYGELASSMGERSSIFGAMILQTSDLESVKQYAENAEALTMEAPDRLALRVSVFDCVLEFVKP